MDLHGVVIYLPALLLHIVRAGAFFVAMPLFGIQRDSRMLRLILAVSLAAIFWGVGEQIVIVDGGFPELIVMVVREAVIGLAAGFGLGLMTTFLVSAGEIISHEMGFSLAKTINPETGHSSSVISQLLQTIGALLILQLDIHHRVIEVLGLSYESLPIGQPFDIEPIFRVLTTLIGKSMVLATEYALPVLGVMLLLTSVLVMLARAVQHINLLEFTFGVRILLALFSSAYFFSEGAPFLVQAFAEMIAEAEKMFLPI